EVPIGRTELSGRPPDGVPRGRRKGTEVASGQVSEDGGLAVACDEVRGERVRRDEVERVDGEGTREDVASEDQSLHPRRTDVIEDRRQGIGVGVNVVEGSDAHRASRGQHDEGGGSMRVRAGREALPARDLTEYPATNRSYCPPRGARSVPAAPAPWRRPRGCSVRSQRRRRGLR